MAAVPIVGAVVGTASTISQISQQNAAAARQKSALDSQARLAEIDTKMRLQEIERQRMFVDQQTLLNNMSRAQEQYLNEAQLSLERQAIDQAEKEAVLNSQIQATITGQQNAYQTSRLLQQYNQAKMAGQLDVAGARMSSDIQYLSESAMNQLGTNNKLFGLTAQLRGNLANIANDEVSAVQNTNSQLSKIADEYKQASAEQRAYLRQRAANLVQLSMGGELSDSDRAFLASMDEEQMQSIIDRTLKSNRTQDLLKQAEDYVLKMSGINRASALSGYESGLATLGGENVIKQTALDMSKNLTDTQRELSYALTNLSQDQAYALEKMNLDNNALLALDLNNIDTVTRLGQLGVDKAGLEVLKLAQKNTYDLAARQDELNKQFSQIALQGSALSVQQAGAAQQAQIQAQRNSIQSTGALGYASALTPAVMQTIGLLSSNRQASTPTNPFYGTGTLSYGFSQLPSFSNQPPKTQFPTNTTDNLSIGSK